MKKIKKVVTILLLASIVLSVAGCGTNTKNVENDNSSLQGDEQGDTKDALSEEKQTFTIATVRWTDAWPTDFFEKGMWKELEEKHNINIEWDIYYYSDWAEQKSLLLGSGDLPDAFWGSITLSDTDLAQNKEAFVELTDLIDTNMPNLKQIFNQYPEMLAAAKDRDGNIFSLVKKLPLRPIVANNMYINQEWLDNLGLEMPTNYMELETVLQEFKNKDADGDGDPNNEYPFTQTATLDNDLRNLLLPFGTMVSRSGNYMGLNDQGEAVFMPVEENYKEAVAWAHNLYKEGLLDPEIFTQDDSMASAKLEAEGGSQTGIFFAWTADAGVEANAPQFQTVPAIAGPSGKRYAESDPSFLDISNRALVITNQCENPEVLLQWADEFYTDLASLQTFYGLIGEQIKDNGDGTYSVLEPEDGTSMDTAAWSNSPRDFGPKFMEPSFQENVILPETQGDGKKLAIDLNEKYATKTFPVCHYTDDQLEKMAILVTDIYAYSEAQYAHWVVDGGVEDEWDGYIEQMNAMGLQDLIAIQKDAYAAYKAITQ